MAAPQYREYYEIDEDGCWIWVRAVSGNGYGNYGNRGAHRVFYERFVGPLIDKMQIDHLCRKRSCVNPEHLEQVTARENINRSMPYRFANMGGVHQLIKTHCPNGHEYNEENTSNSKRKDGRTFRRCKACRRQT